MVNAVFGDSVKLDIGVPEFDQMRINYTRWATGLLAKWQQGVKLTEEGKDSDSDNEPKFDSKLKEVKERLIDLELPGWRQVRK